VYYLTPWAFIDRNMSAHKKKKSKKHKKRRIREENSEAIESLSYAYLKGREVEGG
jgi:hypothetical protein